MSIAQDLLAKDPASQLLGIRLVNLADKSCQVTMLVSDKMTNGYDVCHGGFIFTLADTACAFAGAMQGETILTASNSIDYLAPAKLNDQLIAQAQVSQIVGRNLFCDVTVSDQNGQLIALMRAKLISKNTKV